MTSIASEDLRYEGRDVSMYHDPLGDYFMIGGSKWPFMRGCTAVSRGYIGQWEITGDRLYLVGIDGTLLDGRKATLDAVFPGFPDRVFAHWFSDTIPIPDGELLGVASLGYAYVHEREILLDVERGVITGRRMIENRPAPSDPEPDRDDTPENDDWDGIDPKFAVAPEHLLERLTRDQVEARERVSDPLSAVPAKPFGHLNGAWRRFLARPAQGDEIWSFAARWPAPRWRTERREGYVRIRRGVPGRYLLTVWNRGFA